MKRPGRRIFTLATIGMLAAASAQSPTNQSVIGQPFRVSPSVTTSCSELAPLAMCEAFKPQFARFLAETRDAAWARRVEPLIAKSMLVGGQPKAVIRALEYAVFVDDLDHDVDGDEELANLVEPLGGVFAPELPGVEGRGKIVSVLIYRKRS